MTLAFGHEFSGPIHTWPRLRLNPLFAAWMMGWTWWLEGWAGETQSTCSATESSLSRPPQLSDSSGPLSMEA
ncbi:hypothetical protein [Myxococcus landrumensis]|uniref:hypothetical protein n=1 Tax=Myxococcus landrumensis TaxID=2813577 RepID=UPI001F50893F|nr:hypothetical protein [Myxococcus landrumus]